MSVDRIPPHSLEAEMAILGAVMVQNEQLDVALEHVRAQDFYAHNHEMTFKLFTELHAKGEPLDKITLMTALRERGLVERLGGLPYLNSLLDVAPTSANTVYYARIVAEKAALRRLILAGRDLYDTAFDESRDPVEVAADAGAAIDKAILRSESDGGVSAGQSAAELIERLYRAKDRVTTTPWPTLNEMTGGFMPGEVVVWGANPGTGKTGAMVCLADWISRQEGHVGLFALEMDVAPTVTRMMSLYTDIPSNRLRKGEFRDQEEDRVHEAGSYVFPTLSLTLYGKFPEKSISDVRLACRKLKRDKPDLAAVIIDHIGFLTDVSTPGKESKHERLDRTYKGVIALAMELGLTVHVVQHLNRAAKSGEGSMYDLRDGGNVEGNASAIILLHREHPNDDNVELRREGKFMVVKCREGETGAVEMRFEGSRGLWRETAQADRGYSWFPRVTGAKVRVSSFPIEEVPIPYPDD
jgi:replicative DNA helicase